MHQLPLPGLGRHSPPAISSPNELASAPKLTASSSLASAVQAYQSHLATSPVSRHTARNFACDVALMQRFLGSTRPLGEITSQDLAHWISSLRRPERHLSPKTVNRRVSSIRHFFTWLYDSGILSTNPASAVACHRITPPLPVILSDAECEQLSAAASATIRSHLLVALLLSTGIKKGELLRLRLPHFDLSDPDHPSVWILHDTSKRHKDRRLRLPLEVVPLLREYVARYDIADRLFDCTDRNLEYVLKDLERRLGTGKRVTAQILRDTFAVRQLRAGATIDEVMAKLGLAPSDWNQEIRDKYLKLAADPL